MIFIMNIPNNFICTLRYVSRCDFVFNQAFYEIPYENNRLSEITDNSTIYCYGGFLCDLFKYIEQTKIKNITLISGCEDYATNPNGSIVGWAQSPHSYNIIPCPKNITKWFAQNAEICSDFMKPMPIGPYVFPMSGDGIRRRIMVCERNKLLFTNINPSTNPTQRNCVISTVSKNCPTMANSYGDMNQYCKGLQEHMFSLCPPGNGKDTHRTWESIFFGCIPIVEKSNMNDFFSSLFPMLVVDKWSDVNEDFLRNEYIKIMSKQWRYDLMDVDNLFDYLGIQKSNKHRKYDELLQNPMTTSLTRAHEKNILYV